jgi:folate-binding protein YgfZ
VFPVAANDEVRKQLVGRLGLEAGEMERQRVQARVPAVPVDIGPGDLPNEGALEVDAISYTKGCYLGQEVMARLKSMGKVRRRLLRVTGAIAEWPPLPASLFLGERKVGELRSAVRADGGGFVGLAMLSLLHLTSGGKLGLAAGALPTVQWEDVP